MRTLITSMLCASVVGLSKVSWSAEGDVDFTDYNDVGLRLYDAAVKTAGEGYLFSGRLANAQAKLTLKNPELLIVAQDCSYSDDGSGVCVEIARQTLTIAVMLTPRTTSAINLTLHFKQSPLQVTGLLEWSVWALSAERQLVQPNPSLERP